MSQALLDEIRDVLSRPEMLAKAPSLTPKRLREILAAALELSEWVADVPKTFTWSQHPDDDHLFNLAIAASAEYLVTWETRILRLASGTNPDAERLRAIAPKLGIVTPEEFARRLRILKTGQSD